VVQAVLRSDYPSGTGRQLLTLRDAAEYITALPKAEHEADWQVSMEVLLLVAEHDGPEMLARIAVMKALNRHNPKPTPGPLSKRAKALRQDVLPS
jgi:hypothetical protein